MSAHRIGLLCCLLLLPVAQGCAPPPAPGPVGELQARIVVDRTIQTFIRVFRLAVVGALTRGGVSITCRDIPHSYSLEPMNPELIPLTEPKQLAWEGSTSAAQIGPFDVPAERKLIVAAEGLTRTDQGTFVIARGCHGEVSFPGGTAQELRIDVRATTGAGCSTTNDCEPGLECYRGGDLPGGYCARVGCATDIDCLPGTSCVADDVGSGICARICTNQTDCEASQSQDCVGRLGPDGTCGRTVCIYPLWNKPMEC